MKIQLTPTDIEKIEGVDLKHTKAKNFFQCSHCIEEFANTPLSESMTPREYGMYECSNYAFPYPGGKKEDIVVVWCKRCGRLIWDSRNLVKVY